MAFVNTNRTKYLKVSDEIYLDDLDTVDSGIYVYEYEFENIKNPNSELDKKVNLLVNLYLLFYNKDEMDYGKKNSNNGFVTYTQTTFDKGIRDLFAFNDIMNRIFYKTSFGNEVKKHMYYSTSYNYLLDNNVSINLTREELIRKLKKLMEQGLLNGYFTLKRSKVKIMIDNKIFLNKRYSTYNLFSILSFPEICDTKLFSSFSKFYTIPRKKQEWEKNNAQNKWTQEYKIFDYTNRFNKNTDSANDFLEVFKEKNFFKKKEVKPFFESIVRVLPDRPAFGWSKIMNSMTGAYEPTRHIGNVLRENLEEESPSRIYSFNDYKNRIKAKWSPTWNVPTYTGVVGQNSAYGRDLAFREYVDRRLKKDNKIVFDYIMGLGSYNGDATTAFTLLGNVYSPYRDKNTGMINNVENLTVRYMRNSVTTFSAKIADGTYHPDLDGRGIIFSLFGNPFYDLNIGHLRNRGEQVNQIGVETESVKRPSGDTTLYARKTYTKYPQDWTDNYRPVEPIENADTQNMDIFAKMKYSQEKLYRDRSFNNSTWYYGDTYPNYIGYYYNDMYDYLRNIENKATGQITGYKVEYDMYYEDEDGNRVFLEESVFEMYGKSVMKYNVAGKSVDKDKPSVYRKDKKDNMIKEEHLPKLYYDEEITRIGGIPFVYIRD